MRSRAAQVAYSNGTSGLTADDVQAALDELATGGGSVAASDVSFTPAGTISSTNVQDAIEEVAAEAGGGGGGGTTVLDRRWTAASATADDDEFNDATLDGAWTRVDASGGSGRAVWTEDADSLSLLLNGGDSAGELHGLLKPYALAVGEAIQCHIRGAGPPSQYPHCGLVVTDGTAHGSGAQVYLPLWLMAGQAQPFCSGQRWSGFNNRVAYTDTPVTWLSDGIHLRLHRDAANVWRFACSPDGISWAVINTQTDSLSPTHIGLAGGTWTGGSQIVYSFDYFRIVTP